MREKVKRVNKANKMMAIGNAMSGCGCVVMTAIALGVLALVVVVIIA